MINKRKIGFLFIGLSILIALSNLTILGAVVGTRTSNSISFISLIFFIFGIVLVVKEGGLERSVATSRNLKEIKKLKRALSDGKVGTFDDLRRSAVRAGYKLDEGGPHTKVLYNNRKRVINESGRNVTIPRHGENRGTYRGILRDLTTHDPYNP